MVVELGENDRREILGISGARPGLPSTVYPLPRLWYNDAPALPLLLSAHLICVTLGRAAG